MLRKIVKAYLEIKRKEHCLSQLIRHNRFELKLDSKDKTIKTFKFDAQEFRKTWNENTLMGEIGVAS